MDIENEILIAEFMRQSLYGFKSGGTNVFRKLFFETELRTAEQQGYTLEHVYNQYDFLMQVVGKINGFEGASFRILGTDVKVNYNGRIVARCHTKDIKNSIYGTVIKFIKWYNKENGYTE